MLRTEPAPNRFGASFELASVMEFGTNQLSTSSEPASVMEFGFYTCSDKLAADGTFVACMSRHDD